MVGENARMNKNELIGTLSQNTGLSRSEAASAVEGVFQIIQDTLARGEDVRIVGFGTFSMARRKATTGRNPQTGEPMTIKESNQPRFKAGKVFKDALNV